MENEDFNSRPNCENILIMKKSWFLDKRDSKAVQELKILEKNLESDEKLNDSSIHKVVKLILKQERNSRLNEEFFTQKAIDSGSYGQIVKAKHIRTKIVYAIRKILIGSGFEDKFLKGFKMVSKLKSDNIVHYETFWIEKQYLCIQMEYCEQTLKDMKLEFDNHLLDKNGILSQVGYYTMSEIFKQILEGVNYLHEQNPPIIHSNLKTENILISDIKGKKQIKISNFSSAQTQSQEDKPIGVDLEILNFKPLKQEIIKIYDSKEDIHDLGLILGNLFNIENQRLEKL
jgi:serine/threonine protein kinase